MELVALTLEKLPELCEFLTGQETSLSKEALTSMVTKNPGLSFIALEEGRIIGNILARSEEQAGAKPQGEDAQTINKLRALYNAVLKFSMKKSMA